MIQRMYNLAPSALVQRLSIVCQPGKYFRSAKNWSHLSDVVPGEWNFGWPSTFGPAVENIEEVVYDLQL